MTDFKSKFNIDLKNNKRAKTRLKNQVNRAKH